MVKAKRTGGRQRNQLRLSQNALGGVVLAVLAALLLLAARALVGGSAPAERVRPTGRVRTLSEQAVAQNGQRLRATPVDSLAAIDTRRAVERAQPQLFRVQRPEWPAFDGRWSDSSYWKAHADIDVLPGVRQSFSSHFVLAANGNGVNWPYAGAQALATLANYNITSMAPEDLFGTSGAHESGTFRYWAGELFSDALLDDVQPRSLLEVPLDGENLSRGVVWTGDANVTAALHHDRSLNFFVQIVGRKRWLLFPPSSTLRHSFYPIYHPSRRQAQNNAENVDLDASASEAVVAVVEPGDVLFVPPLWSHEVESLTSSVSYSVVSPSPLELLFSKALYAEVPFGRVRIGVDRVLAVTVYIDMICHRLGKDPIALIRKLYASRYRPMQKFFEAQLKHEQKHGAAHAKEIIDVDCAQRAKLAPKIQARLEPEFTESVLLVAKVMQDENIATGAGVQELLLHDLFDTLFLFAGGSPHLAYSVLRACY